MSNKQQFNQENKWRWVKSPEGSYLQASSLIKHGFQHGFFTKEWNNLGPKELVDVISPGSSIHLTKQIHGSNIIHTSKACDYPWPEADGLVSNKKDQSLWIYTADCIPLLFADPKRRLILACHAGWRGISNGILLKALQKLERLGSNKSKLVIALGPAISGPKYQVELHVAESISKSLFPHSGERELSLKDRIDKLIAMRIAEHDDSHKKILLDIRMAAANQLNKAGVMYEQISINKICTFSNRKLFNSWRRDQAKVYQWSMISSQRKSKQLL